MYLCCQMAASGSYVNINIFIWCAKCTWSCVGPFSLVVEKMKEAPTFCTQNLHVGILLNIFTNVNYVYVWRYYFSIIPVWTCHLATLKNCLKQAESAVTPGRFSVVWSCLKLNVMRTNFFQQKFNSSRKYWINIGLHLSNDQQLLLPIFKSFPTFVQCSYASTCIDPSHWTHWQSTYLSCDPIPHNHLNRISSKPLWPIPFNSPNQPSPLNPNGNPSLKTHLHQLI